MLSIPRIHRCFELGEFDRLVRDVSDNGLSLPETMAIRLSQGETGGIALGLRRLCELTYGPTAPSRAMADRLLGLQQPAGGFALAAGEAPDPVATAAAAAAMVSLLEQPGADERIAMEAALDRALSALGAMQALDGLFDAAVDRTDDDRARTGALVLRLLGDAPAVHRSVRVGELTQALCDRAERFDEATHRLWELARLGAAAGGIVPAVEAIAA